MDKPKNTDNAIEQEEISSDNAQKLSSEEIPLTEKWNEAIARLMKSENIKWEDIKNNLKGCPESYLDRLEKGILTPTIDSHLEISNVLSKLMAGKKNCNSTIISEACEAAYKYQETSVNKNILSKFLEADKNKDAQNSKGLKQIFVEGVSTEYFEYYDLVPNFPGEKLIVCLLRIKPTAKNLNLSVHMGEEFLYVLQGEINFRYADLYGKVLEQPMKKGECVWFRATRAHMPEHRAGDEGAIVLAVYYDPAGMPKISKDGKLIRARKVYIIEPKEDNIRRAGIGWILKRTREQLGLSYTEMAKAVRISRNYYLKIESGGTNFSLKLLNEILNVMDLTWDRLLPELSHVRFGSVDNPIKIDKEHKYLQHHNKMIAEGFYQYELLCESHGTITPMVWELNLKPGEIYLDSHGSQEFIYVLEGALEYRYIFKDEEDEKLPEGEIPLSQFHEKTKSVLLYGGDCFYTNSSDRHHVSRGQPHAKMITIAWNLL